MMIRLQKILSTAGAASRRAAEQLILEGRVGVNGETVRTLGAKADPATDEITLDGRRIRLNQRPRYILLNKPRGYVTTRRDPEGRRTVMDLLARVREYVYPVGRLDYDSDGLLLLTSDGELAARLTHPRHGVARVYEAIVAGDPEDSALEMLRRGLYLGGDDRRPTAPAGVKRATTIGKGRQQTTKLVITLNEGRNRQIRRMCAQIGHPVRQLTRVRMGPITLRDVRPGEWRDLTAAEIEQLQKGSMTPQREGNTKLTK